MSLRLPSHIETNSTGNNIVCHFDTDYVYTSLRLCSHIFMARTIRSRSRSTSLCSVHVLWALCARFSFAPSLYLRMHITRSHRFYARRIRTSKNEHSNDFRCSTRLAFTRWTEGTCVLPLVTYVFLVHFVFFLIKFFMLFVTNILCLLNMTKKQTPTGNTKFQIQSSNWIEMNDCYFVVR